MSIFNFMVAALAGAGGGITLNLTNHSKSDIAGDPGTAIVTVRFNNDGILTLIGLGTTNYDDEWIIEQPVDSAVAGDYEVAYTQLVSGDGPSSGSGLGVYAGLSIDRQWTLSQTGTGTKSGVWKFRVREIADTSNYVEANMTVDVTVSP
jgi:hypothetical protein